MSNSHTRRRFVHIAVILSLAILVGCTTLTPSAPAPAAPVPAAPAPTPQPAAPAPAQTVRVAETAVIGFAPVYIADARGYYREQGLELTFENFTAAADAVPQLARGDFDVNIGAISAGTFNAFARGIGIKIVAPMAILPLQDSALPLLVRKELVDSGTITQIADLRGRRIAIAGQGSINEYILTKALERGGLALADVNPAPLGFPEHSAALASGAVDASTTAEPFATRAISQGAATKFLAEIAPGRMTTVAMYSGQFIQDRNDAARRWMVATMRGVRELQGPELGVSYPDKFYAPENIQAFERKLGVSADVIRNQVPYTWDPDLEIQSDFILDQQLVFMRNRSLQLSEPIPPEQLIDDSFLRHAQQVLGKVRR
jgi:NitT/TauT family transport system substrate-binding protein